MTGDWDWAIPELDELLLTGGLEREDRIQAFVPVLRVRSWRGERVEELLDEVERLARVTSNPQTLYIAAIARADHAFARGSLEDAAVAYRHAAELTPINAPQCHGLAAHAALLARDSTLAASDLAALEATGIHGPAIEARRTSIRAGLATLDGRFADALLLYRDAIRRFRDLGLPVDEAFTAIEMATLLDPTEAEVRAAAESGREVLVRLGARPFLERLDLALMGQPQATEPPRLAAPEGTHAV